MRKPEQRKVWDKVYDVNKFVIRFFTKKEPKGLMKGFRIMKIVEHEEEPASLYLVFSKKQ